MLCNEHMGTVDILDGPADNEVEPDGAFTSITVDSDEAGG